jgi:hypothetical protein
VKDVLILAADFLKGRVLRKDGLLARPWPVLVVEAEEVGRAGLLLRGRWGLEVGLLASGFLIPGADIFVEVERYVKTYL